MYPSWSTAEHFGFKNYNPVSMSWLRPVFFFLNMPLHCTKPPLTQSLQLFRYLVPLIPLPASHYLEA
jgi:hypothetical protein